MPIAIVKTNKCPKAWKWMLNRVYSLAEEKIEHSMEEIDQISEKKMIERRKKTSIGEKN
jgi:hypothetical protein